MIEQNMTFAQENARVVFDYPYIKDVALLQDNSCQARKIEESVEKRLVKQGLRAEYDKEVQGYLDRGTFRELTKAEMEKWRKEGLPVNYISHHGVLKETSLSTKLRIVSNSSLVNNKSGFSLND